MLRPRVQRVEFFRASKSRYVVSSKSATLPSSTSDPTSRAQKRPPVRAKKGKDQTPKSPQNSEFWSDQTAPLVDNLSAASRRSSGVPLDEGTGASLIAPTAAPSQIGENAGGLALRSKAKRRARCRILLMTAKPPLRLKTNDLGQGRHPCRRPYRASTKVHVKVENAPSWVAMSSAMNSNPASDGSGRLLRPR